MIETRHGSLPVGSWFTPVERETPGVIHPCVTRTAPNAMVSTVDHLATATGLDLLRRGGSAADAAVGANAVLGVTSPHMCGMGGDVWALVHDGSGRPQALDSSGRAGSGADADRVRAEGHTRIPLRRHTAAITVPGAVDGWLALHERYGRLPLSEVLADAIRYAEEGFPVAPLLAWTLPMVADAKFNELPGEPAIGDIVTRPGSARALRALADHGRDGFYGGEFGEGLLAVGAGEYSAADLAESQARWVEPVLVEAWGHNIWSPPPTSQGYLTLLSAGIASGFDIGDDPSGTHLLIESAAQAGHDRPTVLFDGADGADLVSAERIAERRAAIDPTRAGEVDVPPFTGDTTYLCVVDSDRMGVSLINSNASGFGSHLIAGTSGIFLHDRGLGFSLQPGHPAEYGPGKRPPHTLSPAMVTSPDGSLKTVLGTMGGDTQPQILLQLLAETLVHGWDPGRAIGAPRWRFTPAEGTDGFSTWQPGVRRKVQLEAPAAAGLAEALKSMGHLVEVLDDAHSQFGHAHMIDVMPSGALAGAADPRALTGIAAGL